MSGNSDRLKEFFNEGLRTLWNWLNRRSQHRSYTRSGFDDCSIISVSKLARWAVIEAGKKLAMGNLSNVECLLCDV